jgi:hypothetical protein
LRRTIVAAASPDDSSAAIICPDKTGLQPNYKFSLSIFQSAARCFRAGTLPNQVLKDPRHKERVSKACLKNGCSREETVCKSLMKRQETYLVADSLHAPSEQFRSLGDIRACDLYPADRTIHGIPVGETGC